jgi:GT2 family glycosyltransferase
MGNNKLAIIIPAFSGHQQLRHCLESLYKSRYSDFDVVIVDHGVTDEITCWIKATFPQAICKRGSPELWWSGASNLGIRHALSKGSTMIMLLNHDCYLRQDTIGTLVSQLQDLSNAIIAPTQINIRTQRETIGATSFFLAGFSTIIPPASWYRRFYPGKIIPVRLIPGGRGVIIRASAFDKMGLFNESQLPHYYADHDFYFRCRKAGIKLYVCGDATVDIDDTMTTLGDMDSKLSLANLMRSLKSRRSHRNIKDLSTLFSLHYPIAALAPVGVALHLVRYCSVYLVKMILSAK